MRAASFACSHCQLGDAPRTAQHSAPHLLLAIWSHCTINNTICAVLQEQYAQRSNVTEVDVHSLQNGVVASIKCGEYVQRVAVHKGTLAALLADSIAVYQRSKEDQPFQLLCSVPLTGDCEGLAVASAHVVFSQKQRIHCFTFGGQRCDLAQVIATLLCVANASPCSTSAPQLHHAAGSRS